MTSNSQHKYILLGLPSTGKTTFIVALWHILQSQELDDSLILARLGGDTTQLSELRDRWLGCDPIPRTTTGFDSLVTFSLQEPTGSQVYDLIFPDASGEKFESQWVDRHWDETYGDLVKDADGVLLFVHCNKIVRPTTVREMNAIYEKLECGEEENSTSDDTTKKAIDIKPWNAAKAPTQVQLVDLLQFIIEARVIPTHALRVALIVSAWDMELKTMSQKNESYSPDEWISKEMPLLRQFLQANPENLTTKIYGLSAQGGDIANSQDKERLQNEVSPSHRVIVCEGTTRNHDISEPIRWMMNLGEIPSREEQVTASHEN